MNDDPANARILLIDDDRQLGEMLSDLLASDGLALSACLSGEDGLKKLKHQQFDILILDVMLPGINGLDVLRQLRIDNDIPVIMLTARGDDVDRIIGLEIGADDYLPKPFNPRELSARIKALLRRTVAGGGDKQMLQVGNIALDVRTRTVSVNNQSLRLTGTEFEILRALLEQAGDVVSKESLSERALGRRLLPYDRSIDTHISNLRGKLDQSGAATATIQNQRGIGYLLIPTQ